MVMTSLDFRVTDASHPYVEGDGDVLSRLQPFHSQPGFLFLLEPPKKRTVQMLVGQVGQISQVDNVAF